MRHETIARGVLVVQQRTQERGAAVPQARRVLSSSLQYLCLSGRLAGDAVMHMTPSRFACDASLMLPLRQSLDVNKPVLLDTVWMHVLHLILAQLWPGLDLPVGLISYLAFRRHSCLPSQSIDSSPRLLVLGVESSSLFSGKCIILTLGQVVEVFGYFQV